MDVDENLSNDIDSLDEKIIDLVKLNPILWDNKLSEFRDIKKKAKIYSDIGDTLEIEAIEAEKRFIGLREKFRRYKTRNRNNIYDNGGWNLYDKLSFLNEVVKPTVSCYKNNLKIGSAEPKIVTSEVIPLKFTNLSGPIIKNVYSQNSIVKPTPITLNANAKKSMAMTTETIPETPKLKSQLYAETMKTLKSINKQAEEIVARPDTTNRFQNFGNWIGQELEGLSDELCHEAMKQISKTLFELKGQMFKYKK